MPGDIVLLRLDAFQGKRKVKDGHSNIQYKVLHQVVADMPAYELHYKGGNVKVIHLNRFFLVAPVEGGMSHPWAERRIFQLKCLIGPP